MYAYVVIATFFGK